MSEERKPDLPPAYIGTSGSVLPPAGGLAFPAADSKLERYSSRLNAAEIHSSFHRAHPATVYAQWAASVPDDFRFSVKMHQAITHDARLAGPVRWLDEFVRETSGLGEKLGCFLMELPPNLVFNMQAARPPDPLLLGVRRRRLPRLGRAHCHGAAGRHAGLVHLQQHREGQRNGRRSDAGLKACAQTSGGLISSLAKARCTAARASIR